MKYLNLWVRENTSTKQAVDWFNTISDFLSNRHRDSQTDGRIGTCKVIPPPHTHTHSISGFNKQQVKQKLTSDEYNRIRTEIKNKENQKGKKTKLKPKAEKEEKMKRKVQCS